MLYPFSGRYFNKRRHFFSYDFKDYSFKVDLEFGELYFTRKLMSFSGKHLPLNLSLKYVQSHINGSDYLNSLTDFPHGFKTNFHIFLEFDSNFNKFKYEDADGFVHEFTLAYNSSTLYYDNQGNIVSKKEYAYSTNQSLTNPLHSYNYRYDEDFPNRLIRFDTQDIQYDAIGNPTLYKGQQLAWTRGTLLSEVSDTTKAIELTYDGFKQRIAKTITNLSNNNVTSTEYYYIDGQLLKENTGNKTITYIYSHQGIIGFSLSGYSAISNLNGTYLFEKNVQQDVIAIRNSSNQIVARYIYDAWGNHKVLNPNNTPNTSDSFIGNINPIRYRSYYYDTDLKMYWLTTRYYDPEIGRFISPDSWDYLDYKKLHSLNLYAYSKNNPVMYYDPSGHLLLFLLVGYIFVVPMANTILSKHDAKVKNIDKNSDVDDSVLEYYNEEPYRNGNMTVLYRIVRNDNENKTTLEVYESWKYTKQEMMEFLVWLSRKEENQSLNVSRVANEWKWHNIVYTLGFAKESTESVMAYFNASDDRLLYSLFFDLLWLC